MKNKKGFTLVELLAVIVILAVIILIAVNAVLPQMRKARENSFVDEAINFAKAAETAYVSDSLKGEQKECYTIDELKGQYVAKNDAKYKGKVHINVDENDNITKKIYITDGNSFYIAEGNPTSTKKTDMDAKKYTAEAWAAIKTTTAGVKDDNGALTAEQCVVPSNG